MSLGKPSEVTPMWACPRDGLQRPLVVPKAGGKPVAHIRVTTFVKAVDDITNLMAWKARKTLVGAAMDAECDPAAGRLLILPRVGLHDSEDKAGKKAIDLLVEEALEFSGANEKRKKGTLLHGYSELVDGGLPLPPEIERQDAIDMASYAMRTEPLQMHDVERLIALNSYKVAGTPDRTCYYSGPGPNGEWIEGLFIADLKTGNTEYGQLVIACQLAIYACGEFYDFTRFRVDINDKAAVDKWKKVTIDPEEAAAAYTPLEGINKQWAIVIRLPAGGGETYLDWVPIDLGMEAVELAFQTRKVRSKKKLFIPFQNTPVLEVETSVEV